MNLDILNKKEEIGSKTLLLLILTAYFLIYFSLVSLLNFDLMKYSGISTLRPCFADLRVITSGLDCIRKGQDPLISNPCDPWGRQMNYPRIW
jgi:hypothetical protein